MYGEVGPLHPVPMRASLFALGFLLASCSTSGDSGFHGDAGPTPGDTCGSIRLTSYTASATGWCEFDRTQSFLPTFVRSGLTAAIAEPWNGGSYGGASGEACGECWEISTIHDTRVVMIHDLCPIAGNVPCNGSHFHFDLASEAGTALGAGGMDEGSARRVPCPVTGNAHIQVNDLNPNYLRAAFVNHRIPIRLAEVRGAGAGVGADNPWHPMERSGGAWQVSVSGSGVANGGTGFSIRLTSTQGEVVESSVVVPSSTANRTSVDLGVQLTDQASAGAMCSYMPPAGVFIDDFGGIPSVLWAINPWGAAENGDGIVSSPCVAGSCLRVPNLNQWTGFHLYYRQAFPTSTFTSLHVSLRTVSGSGMVTIAPSNDGVRCTETTVPVSTTYAETTIDLATVCTGMTEINGITFDNPGPSIGLLLDDVRFVP